MHFCIILFLNKILTDTEGKRRGKTPNRYSVTSWRHSGGLYATRLYSVVAAEATLHLWLYLILAQFIPLHINSSPWAHTRQHWRGNDEKETKTLWCGFFCFLQNLAPVIVSRNKIWKRSSGHKWGILFAYDSFLPPLPPSLASHPSLRSALS